MKGMVIATLVIVSLLLILAGNWFWFWLDYASTLVDYIMDYINDQKENPRYITIDDNDALEEQHKNLHT